MFSSSRRNKRGDISSNTNPSNDVSHCQNLNPFLVISRQPFSYHKYLYIIYFIWNLNANASRACTLYIYICDLFINIILLFIFHVYLFFFVCFFTGVINCYLTVCAPHRVYVCLKTSLNYLFLFLFVFFSFFCVYNNII